MNGLDFLNLVIGLIFIYLIYSIAASTIWEIIVSITNLRGKTMRNWIIENFNEFTNDEKKKLSSEILDHPIIKGLSKNSHKKPIYISSELFTDVLIDLVVKSNSNDVDSSEPIVDINSFKDSLETTKSLNPGLKRVFLQYLSEDSKNLKKVKEKIGRWYDEAQERLLGSYKKSLQIWIFIISLILVSATNADTIKLASYLYGNPDAREAIANKVDIFVQDSAVESRISTMDTTIIDSIARQGQNVIIANIDENLNTLKELNKELRQTGIPIGWSVENIKLYNFWGILKKIGGLLLTVFAVSLGAPFWFDILNKLANLRSSGNKPKSSLEEKKS